MRELVGDRRPYADRRHYLIAAVQKLGLDAEQYAEVLAVIGLYNQMNALVEAMQIEPDILPEPY